MHPPAPIALALLAAALLLGGCGGDEEPGSADEPAERTITDSSDQLAPAQAPAETGDPLPELPSGWGREVNREAGFAIGVPPGWKARPSPEGQGSVLVSPDELVVISLSADRTEGALGLPLEEFARRTAEALGSEAAGAGRFRQLSVGSPAPFGHAYEAAAVRALGTPRGSGVDERLLVAVVRREDLATYVAVVRENAERRSRLADRDTVKRVIRSLRGRPAQ